MEEYYRNTVCLRAMYYAVQEWSSTQVHGNLIPSKATVSAGIVCCTEVSWNTRQVKVKTKYPKPHAAEAL